MIFFLSIFLFIVPSLYPWFFSICFSNLVFSEGTPLKVELCHQITKNVGPREPVTWALTLIAWQNSDLLCVCNLCLVLNFRRNTHDWKSQIQQRIKPTPRASQAVKSTKKSYRGLHPFAVDPWPLMLIHLFVSVLLTLRRSQMTQAVVSGCLFSFLLPSLPFSPKSLCDWC